MELELLLNYLKNFALFLVTFLVLVFLYNFLFRRGTEKELVKTFEKCIRIPCYLLSFLISLLVVNYFLPKNFEENFLVYHYESYIFYFIKILLLIIGVEILLFFIFDYIAAKKEISAFPTIFRDIIKFVVYVTLIIFVLDSLEINITPFLTTAGLLTMVIGFALQDTLGNVFAGLAMQFSSPFKPGDIIDTGEVKGRVEKIDWRATYIITRKNDYVTVPHSVMAKLDIENHSQPTGITKSIIHIGANYESPPTKVIKVIKDTLNELDEIPKDKESRVMVKSYDDFAVTYEIEFPLIIKDDVGYFECIEGKVLERLWFRFKREDIKIPFPIRNVYLHESPGEEDILCPFISIFKKVDFLSELSDDKLKHLAKKCNIEYFIQGETVCKYGEEGESFYIIKSGEVDVYFKFEDNETIVKTLRENEFFGEMSLLTGEPRSATIKVSQNAEFIVLKKEHFVDLIKSEPEIAEIMSRVIAHRERDSERYKTGKMDSPETEVKEEEKSLSYDNLKNQILTKIRKFFLLDR